MKTIRCFMVRVFDGVDVIEVAHYPTFEHAYSFIVECMEGIPLSDCIKGEDKAELHGYNGEVATVRPILIRGVEVKE